MKKQDLSGQRFGKLTVIREAPRYISPKGESRVSWVCKCDCGNETTYRSTTLKFSGVKGCGCVALSGDAQRKHGKTKDKVYRAWCGMKNRCLNAKTPRYSLYGGRGIELCEEWKAFENFYSDMGDPPSQQHSIERKDVNGPYAPWNCKWATQKEQTRNQRRNVLIQHNGKIQCVAAWCEELGLLIPTVFNRIYKGETDPSVILRPVSK